MTDRRVLHIISQAHLDPVWLWKWNEGCSEALTTMQSAVDRMAECDTLKFSRSSACVYRWAKEMDPRLYAEIQRLVRENRWEIVNGWVVQPDCNLAATESYARQALYGKRFFQSEFGVDVKTGYCLDPFGHAWGLPQILARAGFKHYVFMRPQEHESSYPRLFWWEAPDGSRVLCARVPGGGYGQPYHDSANAMENQLREHVENQFAPGFDHGLYFMGVGNHGGGPTRTQIERMQELMQDDGLPELRFSTLAEFFAEVETEPAYADLPVVREGLQRHAPGCYAAVSMIKQLNRRAERWLVQSEMSATIAAIAGLETPYPLETLREAWWTVLFNQFHDILPGSSVQPAYEEARDQLGGACDTAKQITTRTAHALSRRIDTTGAPEGVLVLYNPLPWPRKAVVEADTFVSPHGDSDITHLLTADGEQIPFQWADADACFGPFLHEWHKLTAVVDLPASGYRALHLAHGETAPQRATSSYTWHPAKTTVGIESLCAPDGTELLNAPIGLVVIDDQTDTWGHGADRWRNELGRPTLVRSETLADGPVFKRVRQWGIFEKSQLVVDITDWFELGAIEIRLRVNWQQQRQLLKLEIPTGLQDVRYFAKMPGSINERETGGLEDAYHDWLALQGTISGQEYTLGLINDGTYSCDVLDGLARTVVVRGAPYAQHNPIHPADNFFQPYHDQGWIEKRFWIVVGSGDYAQLRLHQTADSLQTPAFHVFDSAHPGDQPWEQSFLSIDCADAEILAFKAAEDGSGYILRIQEMRGVPSDVRVNIAAWKLDTMVALAPWEIATLRIEPGAETTTQRVSITEE